jgi:MerR family redox-sensitive transcriptional activator SoxR
MLSIGEVAKLSDVPASTLRYYEQVGLIPPTNRINGQRKYTPDILQRIQIIKMAQLSGFQVSEIFVLLEGFNSNVSPSERWKSMANLKRLELEEKSKQIELMQQTLDNGLKCKCLSWDDCFTKIDKNGDCS